MHMHSHLALENQAPPSTESVFIMDGDFRFPSTSSMALDARKPAKKGTRQWAAWTRQEEESFFNALRQVGKNFEKITSRVQSKNKDQVRHYYYRLVRRINKLLGPGFCLDAKNSKDTNAAMLRWWALLEKHSCTASKLHLKPRRFKLFIEALEHQLLKDRNKTRRKHLSQEENCLCAASTTILSKASGNDAHPVKVLETDAQNAHKVGASKGASLKRNMSVNSNFNRGDVSSMKGAKQKRRAGIVASAAYRRWEKAAMAGVSLVADAAEQLERAASGQKNIISIRNNAYPLAHREVCSHHIGETIVQPSTKLKLQLFPIDEDTRNALEKDGHNPHLELTLSAKKRISSVIDHLNRKWGNSSIASGELMLFPYSIQQENIARYQRWTIKDIVASAGDVYAAIHSPIFRLRYGWFSNTELGSDTVRVSSGGAHLGNCMQSDNIQESDSKNMHEDATEPQRPKQSAEYAEDRSNSMMAPPPSLVNISEVMVDGNSIKSNDGCEEHADVAALGMKNDARVLTGEWADSLTNMSVGDLLSEASRACDSDPIDPSFGESAPCLQQIEFSCDSFDAAVAAHVSGYQLPGVSNQVPHSVIWSGEETRDEFSFRLSSALKRGDPNPSSCTSPRVSQKTCSTSLSFHGHLKDFNESGPSDHPSCKDSETLCEPPKDLMLEMGKLDSSKDPCLTDAYWPDSLGPLELDMPSFRYHAQDLVFGDSVSLGGLSHLLANSLGALYSCSAFGVDKKDPLANEARGASMVLDGKICSED